jgi:GTP 3',8-cyclase
VSLPVVETFSPNDASQSTPLAQPLAPRSHRQHPTRLIDSFGRVIHDLRLSITDRCNFRCVYCMDPDVKFAPKDDLLTIDEHLAIARVAVRLGVTKLRITGGEPALHPGLLDLIAGLSSLNVQDVAITTNGSFLDAATARQWRDAGLTRVTLSLDSLRQDRFKAITRSGSSVTEVLAGIAAAREAGLDPVRVNAVIVRGFNEDELVDLARLARDLAIDVRLIEYMPLDSAHAWERNKVVTATEMLERISRVFPLEPIGRDTTSSPATVFRFADRQTINETERIDGGAHGEGRIGVIASVTRSFCSTCSRLRITADGKVRPCLFAHHEWDIRPLLRSGASHPDAIARFLQDAVYAKSAGHAIDSPEFRQPDRTMSAIGG